MKEIIYCPRKYMSWSISKGKKKADFIFVKHSIFNWQIYFLNKRLTSHLTRNHSQSWRINSQWVKYSYTILVFVGGNAHGLRAHRLTDVLVGFWHESPRTVGAATPLRRVWGRRRPGMMCLLLSDASWLHVLSTGLFFKIWNQELCVSQEWSWDCRQPLQRVPASASTGVPARPRGPSERRLPSTERLCPGRTAWADARAGSPVFSFRSIIL